MSDEWGEQPVEEDGLGPSQASESQRDEAVAGKRKRGRPIGTGAKAKPKAKNKSQKDKKAENKKCFHGKRSDLKAANCKFCKKHHRFAESMKYQAGQKKTTYNDVVGAPSKAAVALDDWERDNPEGSARK